MGKLHFAAAILCISALVTGCSKSTEQKMVSVCSDVAKFSVADPSWLVINSSSAKEYPVTKESLSRFTGLWSRGVLNSDQKTALDNILQEISKIKEVYAVIDFTDKSSESKRQKAICWFMDRGDGFELGSVSVGGKSYSGIDLMDLFVQFNTPEYLDSSNKLN